MAVELDRNFKDKPDCVVEEIGLTEDGRSDHAIARIQGTYPMNPETFVRNNVSDMLIYPMTGIGKVILLEAGIRRQFRIDPKNNDPIKVPHGTPYCYSAELGETVQVGMICTPPWTAAQYEEVNSESVN